MSVDSRLQYLWKSQLDDAKPPPQQEDGAIYQQQSPQGGGNFGQDISAATIGVPIRSQGPQSPRQKKKTASQSRECRDRWRLGAEIATAIIGAVGLGALIVTLDQSRQATESALQSVTIARKQMELSERPWITVDVALTGPVGFSWDGSLWVNYSASLKNVGHSVAMDIRLYGDIVLSSYSSHQSQTVEAAIETIREPQRRRDEFCEGIRHPHPQLSGIGGPVLFPDQQTTIERGMGFARKELVDERAFDNPAEAGKFVKIILVGCVGYKTILSPIPYVTGFMYSVSATPHHGFFRVGETVPVESITLRPREDFGAYIK